MYRKFKTLKNSMIVSIALIALGNMSFAQSAEINESWEGHKTTNLCYAVSFPNENSAPSPSVVNSRYVTVSQRPENNITNEIAFVSGFHKDEPIEGSVSIDGNLPFQLLYYNGVGFAKSGDSENMIIAQMKAGRMLEIKWTNQNGEYFVDKYSLIGFTASYNFTKDCK